MTFKGVATLWLILVLCDHAASPGFSMRFNSSFVGSGFKNPRWQELQMVMSVVYIQSMMLTISAYVVLCSFAFHRNIFLALHRT